MPPERHFHRTMVIAVAAGILPLWLGGTLPLVDLPQHLHLISVLHRLDDPTTLYPQVFAARGELTPYLGYYYAVSALNWLLPLEVANRLFLSCYVAGLPLALAFMLGSLGRPRWPALLAIPFAYGDSLAWGFINYCAAVPLGLLSAGLFVRAVVDRGARWAWAVGAAGSLVAVLLFHVQVYAFLGVALPVLLLTTPVPGEPPLRARLPAVLATVPSVGLFVVWVLGRVGEPSTVEYGAPWRAWGPMLSPQNLAFKPFARNWSESWSVVANQLRDGSDRYPFYLAVGVALVAWAVWLLVPDLRAPTTQGFRERARLPLMAAVAWLLYFALPFDIRGYIYYLNTRYAHLAWPLMLACVPAVRWRAARWLSVGAAAPALGVALLLGRGFHAFGQEAVALQVVSAAAAPGARVMGLIYNPSSQVVNHPVYLHAAATVARAHGGYANFSFALTPHSPLRYRGAPPPTFPSEWRPDAFRYETHGHAYDHFLLRGPHPALVLGEPMRSGQLTILARQGDFWLVGRAQPRGENR